MLTLTGKEIKDLAEAVGLVIAPHDYTDELETEMTVIDCPASGVLDDDGKVTHYDHVAYLSEYPEEGIFPLGDEVTQNDIVEPRVTPRLTDRDVKEIVAICDNALKTPNDRNERPEASAACGGSRSIDELGGGGDR